jgi:hypothetical protein
MLGRVNVLEDTMRKIKKTATADNVREILNSEAWRSIIDKSWSDYKGQALPSAAYTALLEACFRKYTANVERYLEKNATHERCANADGEALRQDLFEKTLMDFNGDLGELSEEQDRYGERDLGDPVAHIRNLILGDVYSESVEAMMDRERPPALVGPGEGLGDIVEAKIIHMVMTDTLNAATPGYLLEEFERLRELSI